MNRISTGRRDFLKQAGLIAPVAMMAGMPEGAMAFGGGRGRVVEDAVLRPRRLKRRPSITSNLPCAA